MSPHNTGLSVSLAVHLGKVFEGSAWEGTRQALEEEGGRTEEMVGSAREGEANFQGTLEWALEGKWMYLEGEGCALEEFGRVKEVEGRA